MKVAVTGSSGLIGTALTASLEGDGHNGPPPGAPPGSRAAAGGPPDRRVGRRARHDRQRRARKASTRSCTSAGVGIGDKRWNDEHRRNVLESRRKGTDLLSRTLAALSSPPRVLLSGSANGIYGDRGDEVLTEFVRAGRPVPLGGVLRMGGPPPHRPKAGRASRVAHLRTGLVVTRPTGGFMGRMLPLVKLGLGGQAGPRHPVVELDRHGRRDRGDPIPARQRGRRRLPTSPRPSRSRTRAFHEGARPCPCTGPRSSRSLRSAPASSSAGRWADELLFASQRAVPTALLARGATGSRTRTVTEALPR